MSSNKSKIELNSDGIKEMLKSQEIMDAIEDVAVAQYGEVSEKYVGFDRCHVFVEGE